VGVYFLGAEAPTNVVKYARASAAQVRLRRDGHELEVTIADDGAGGADPTRGSGLRGLWWTRWMCAVIRAKSSLLPGGDLLAARAAGLGERAA
jgi:nitrate/nitrite-specific signal transduction histidine kinase